MAKKKSKFPTFLQHVKKMQKQQIADAKIRHKDEIARLTNHHKEFLAMMAANKGGGQEVGDG